MRCTGSTPAARVNANCNKQAQPRNEQDCLGTAIPLGVVVKSRSRFPSPPASTIAQGFLLFFICVSSVQIPHIARNETLDIFVSCLYPSDTDLGPWTIRFCNTNPTGL